MTRKIAIIGALSRFGPGLVDNFIRAADLAGSSIVLYDIGAAHLELIRRYAEARKKTVDANIRFESTCDLRETLSGSALAYTKAPIYVL